MNGSGAEQLPDSWLLKQAQTARLPLAVSCACSLAVGVAVIIQARLLAEACQRVVIAGSPVAAIVPLAGTVAVVAMLRGLLSLVAERYAARAAAMVKQQVRTGLYRRLLAVSPAASGRETGELVEAVTTGVEGLENYITRFLPHLVLAAVLPAAMLLAVFPAEWRPGLVLLFSAPFIPLFMVLIGRGAETLNRRQWVRLGRLSGRLLDLVQGLPDVRAFGVVKREAALLRQASDDYRAGTMMVLRVAFLSAFTLEFFSTVGTAVVAVIIGFRLLSGSLGLADGLFVLLLAPEFYLPLRTLGLSYHARMQGTAAAETIIPLLSHPLPRSVLGALPVPAGPPELTFENVSYRYASGRGGVTGISLGIAAGSLTVLAGESGSGKTTLVRLLTGFILPEAGRVLVNGVALDELDCDAWRRRVAWVPQRPFFFAGTVRENLLLGCPDASGADIESALEASAAAGFIAALPEGLETRLGGAGSGVSGGELRRLALARALLRTSSLVVLDEPTAGLDPAGERLVAETIRRLAGERTILVISHREDTVRMADRVAVLSGGRLAAIVGPDEYLAVRGAA